MTNAVEKYGFNTYDTITALVLTQYLKERDYKAELGKAISGKQVSAPALAELLDRAALWATTGLADSDEYITENIIEAVRLALEDFSGEEYVHAMDAGFAEFLDDFLNDRVK